MYTLYNSDCLETISLLAKIDCIIADLPYFQVVKAEFDNQWNSETDYLEWVENVLTLATEKLKNNGNCLLFCSRQLQWKICIILDKLKLLERRTIIWPRRRGANSTRGKALASGYEPILFWSKGLDTTFNNIKIKVDTKLPKYNRPEYITGIMKDGITLSDVWADIPALPHNSKEKTKHPTQKPIKLMERIVSLFTNENDTVLDFCMGSGSTGVACLNLNRNFIGIEKDTEYFNIAKKRMDEIGLIDGVI